MTLRARLTLMLALTLLPLGAVLALGLYLFVRSSLLARLDDALAARAEAIAGALKVKDGSIEFDFEEAAMPPYSAGSPGAVDPARAAYFEVWSMASSIPSQLIEKSASLGALSLTPSDTLPECNSAFSLDMPGDTDVRVLSRTVVPPDDKDDERRGAAAPRAANSAGIEVLVIVAVSREPVDGPLETLAAGLVCAGVVFTVVGGLAVRWALARGLAPVRSLADSVNTIDVQRPGTRIDVPRLPAEIAPVQLRINALLERVEQTMQRERRFTTAAAHELRTPVAELRTLLEVAVSRSRSAEEAVTTLSTALVCVERLDRLVSALLRLTRIEASREAPILTDVAIEPLLQECIAAMGRTIAARRIRFDVAILTGQTVPADREFLGLAISNLIANAAEYADEGATVDVRLVQDGTSVTLSISNPAASLARIDPSRLGEPLFRPDAARTPGDHMGLGLSFARAALGVFGASVAVRIDSGPRFTASVVIIALSLDQSPPHPPAAANPQSATHR